MKSELGMFVNSYHVLCLMHMPNAYFDPRQYIPDAGEAMQVC